MRISDWSSDVCSSDLDQGRVDAVLLQFPDGQSRTLHPRPRLVREHLVDASQRDAGADHAQRGAETSGSQRAGVAVGEHAAPRLDQPGAELAHAAVGGEILDFDRARLARSEEHTSELQSLMRSSYAVFCLKQKKRKNIRHKR